MAMGIGVTEGGIGVGENVVGVDTGVLVGCVFDPGVALGTAVEVAVGEGVGTSVPASVGSTVVVGVGIASGAAQAAISNTPNAQTPCPILTTVIIINPFPQPVLMK